MRLEFTPHTKKKIQTKVVSFIIAFLLLAPFSFSQPNSQKNLPSLSQNKAYAQPSIRDISISQKVPKRPVRSTSSPGSPGDGAAQDYYDKQKSSADNKPDITDYMKCNLMKGAPGFTGCLAVGTYYLLYMPASFILGAIGNFFDIVLLLSISRGLIDQEFIKTVWENVRDLANMAFIFILLWVAIATILRVRNNTAKDLLSKLIIVALLINFSFFITRVIVDAGNMFAMFFYNDFEVHKTQNVKDGEKLISGNSVLKGTFIEQWIGEGDVKGVSGAFLHYTSINEMISLENGLVKAKGGTWLKLWTDQVVPPETQHFNLIIYFLLSASLMGVLAWILFTTSFLFLTRVAILWLLMAVSPLAFVGMILPQSAAYVRKNFWGELVSKSFCITVFLFLLWFTLQFLEGANTWNNFGNNKDFFETFIIVLLKFTVLTAILFYAKNITKKMCDSIGGVSLDIGKKIAGIAGAAVGLGAAVATGGTALLGRGVLGAGAMKNLNRVGSDGMTRRQRLASGGKLDRLRLRAMEGMEKGSFDARNTKLGGMAMGKAGGLAGAVGMGGVTKSVGAWGVKGGEGGFAGTVEREDKKQDELRKKMGDLNDKDETKAAAARKAHTRYEERLLKESGVTGTTNEALTNNPYYQSLKRVSQGHEDYDAAQEEMRDVEKEAKKQALDRAARGVASAKTIAKAQAAQKTGSAIKKGDELREKRANVEAEKARDKARIDSMKKTYGTPQQAQTQMDQLNTTLGKIAVLMKLEEKRENKLVQQNGALSAVPNRSSAQNQELASLESKHAQSLSNFETLSKLSSRQEKKMGELKEYTRLAEKQNRYAREDISNVAKNTTKATEKNTNT
ncbi:MAG: hypothetical protein H8D63_00905 [Parcubacteria group bacterium]|nr:hypothetical protein [Parcubacteria group bacterium]